MVEITVDVKPGQDPVAVDLAVMVEVARHHVHPHVDPAEQRLDGQHLGQRLRRRDPRRAARPRLTANGFFPAKISRGEAAGRGAAPPLRTNR